MSRKRTSPFPHMGLAAAAFAAVLVVFSMDSPSEIAKRAVVWFAIGIPLAVASPAIWYTRERVGKEWLLITLSYVAILVGGIGDIACLGGIYLLFKSVSPDAATLFFRISIVAYVLWAGTETGLEIADQRKRFLAAQRAKKEAAEQRLREKESATTPPRKQPPDS